MFNQFADGYFQPFIDRRWDYSIPKIEQINTDGMRFYATPSGAKYPSMSTIVKMLSADAIQQWRKRVGPEEATRVGARASRRGTALHKLAEHYILGEETQFVTSFRKSMPDAQSNWTGVKAVLDQRLGEVRATECQLFSHRLRLAGTTDCIGMWDGKLSVIDFKTSMKWKKREWIDGYFYQCDGYGCMWEEITGETPEQCVIIIATDVAKEPQVFIEPYGASLAKLKQLRLEFFRKNGF